MLQMTQDASCARDGIKTLKLKSVPSAVPLYEKFGFTKENREEVKNEENKFLLNCPSANQLVPMSKKIS